MKCKNCNEEIKEDFDFCPYCGIPVKEDSSAYFIRQVMECRKRGKIRKALENCKKLSKELDDPYIYKLVGDLAYLTGELEFAEKKYEKSLKLLPDFPDTLYALGICHFRMGRISKAIQYFEKCIDMNPNFSMAYYWLGHSYYHTGQIDESISNFLKLIDHSPQSKIAHYHLGITYHSKGENEIALEHFKNLEKIGVKHASLYYHIGNMHFILYDYPDAVKYLKKSLELNPEEERAKSLLKRISETPEI